MSEPVQVIFEMETALALFSYLRGEQALTGDQLEDAKNSLAQALAIPLPRERERI